MTKIRGGPPSPRCYESKEEVAQLWNVVVATLLQLSIVNTTSGLSSRWMRPWERSDRKNRFRGWPPNLCEEEGERFPNRIPLCHVVVADRPNRAIMYPGGALLRHWEELRRWGNPRSLDQIPDDWMMEISVENASSQLGKVRPNPTGIFPRDTCRALNGSRLLIESVQKVSGPISAQIWAIDLWARCLKMIGWCRMGSTQHFDDDHWLEEDAGRR